MPSVAAYKKAFRVTKGTVIPTQGGEFKVKRSDIEHIVAQKFERYEFPTVLALVTENKFGKLFPRLFGSLADRVFR